MLCSCQRQVSESIGKSSPNETTARDDEEQEGEECIWQTNLLMEDNAGQDEEEQKTSERDGMNGCKDQDWLEMDTGTAANSGIGVMTRGLQCGGMPVPATEQVSPIDTKTTDKEHYCIENEHSKEGEENPGGAAMKTEQLRRGMEERGKSQGGGKEGGRKEMGARRMGDVGLRGAGMA